MNSCARQIKNLILTFPEAEQRTWKKTFNKLLQGGANYDRRKKRKRNEQKREEKNSRRHPMIIEFDPPKMSIEYVPPRHYSIENGILFSRAWQHEKGISIILEKLPTLNFFIYLENLFTNELPSDNWLRLHTAYQTNVGRYLTNKLLDALKTMVDRFEEFSKFHLLDGRSDPFCKEQSNSNETHHILMGKQVGAYAQKNIRSHDQRRANLGSPFYNRTRAQKSKKPVDKTRLEQVIAEIHKKITSKKWVDFKTEFAHMLVPEKPYAIGYWQNVFEKVDEDHYDYEIFENIGIINDEVSNLVQECFMLAWIQQMILLIVQDKTLETFEKKENLMEKEFEELGRFLRYRWLVNEKKKYLNVLQKVRDNEPIQTPLTGDNIKVIVSQLGYLNKNYHEIFIKIVTEKLKEGKKIYEKALQLDKETFNVNVRKHALQNHNRQARIQDNWVKYFAKSPSIFSDIKKTIQDVYKAVYKRRKTSGEKYDCKLIREIQRFFLKDPRYEKIFEAQRNKYYVPRKSLRKTPSNFEQIIRKNNKYVIKIGVFIIEIAPNQHKEELDLPYTMKVYIPKLPETFDLLSKGEQTELLNAYFRPTTQKI